MKAKVLGVDGKKLREVELPVCFDAAVREDIISKVFEAGKRKQPFSPNIVAGMQHSASGKIRHARRKWKTSYGYGISRVPRKIHTRRGRRFFWVGATAASTRGGRQAHPPKIDSMLHRRKINKKEKRKALIAALAATASLAALKKRYTRLAALDGKKIEVGLPLVFDSKVIELNVKELRKLVRQVLNGLAGVAEKERKQRAGKGKSRGRKYKQSKGMLVVTASGEKLKCKYFDASNAKKLNIEQLAPGGKPGRLVVYTEKAISELAERFGSKEASKDKEII